MPRGLRACRERLYAGMDVLPEDASSAIKEIMKNVATESEMASFLTAMTMRGPPSPAVLGACADAMAEFAEVCTPKASAAGEVVVDIVGTGGDGKDAFNVSTAAAIVVAACGVTVAKHGNRSSSGSVGS